MEMTGLEVFLGGTALTALGGWLSAIRGVSRGECKQLRDHIRTDLLREINEDRESVKLHQEKVSRQLNSLFRMVRSLVVHSDISKEEQDRILNDR